VGKGRGERKGVGKGEEREGKRLRMGGGKGRNGAEGKKWEGTGKEIRKR